MADKLLIVTNDQAGVGRIYVGDTSNPATILLKDSQAASTLQKCDIKPSNGNNMVVAGTVSKYSVDGGATWDVSAMPGSFLGSNNLRNFSFMGGNDKVFLLDLMHLYVSSDNGATFDDLSSGIPAGGQCFDILMNSDTSGWLIKNLFNDHIYRTSNGGVSWTAVQDLHLLPGWVVGDETAPGSGIYSYETCRKIIKWGPGQDLLLLSSHKLWLLTWNGTVFTGTIIVDLIAWLDNAFPASAPWITNAGMRTTSPVYGIGPGGQYNDHVFNELYGDYASGRVWISGTHNIRIHSFNLVDFYLSDPTYADGSSNGELPNYTMLDVLTSSMQFINNDRVGPALAGNQPGVWKSISGGVTATVHKVFSGEGERSFWLSALQDPPVAGCTIATACNYDPSAEADDGSCMLAVKLTNCVSGLVIHTQSPEIKALACTLPRWSVDFQALTSNPQAFQFQVDGLVVFSYSATIDPLLGMPDTLITFIQGLVAYINTSTPFTAQQIPPLLNTLNPGSNFGIWITYGDASGAGLAAVATTIGLAGVTQDSQFSTSLPGAVIKVTEYPGECWTVCGDGDCALAQVLTLAAAYVDCMRCIPTVPPLLCLDCATVLSINGTPLTATNDPSCATQCGVSGQTVHFEIAVGFPDRDSVNLVPNEAGNGCSGACPVVLTFPGNQEITLPAGSQFTENPSGDVYTVDTVTYDQDLDVTTIVTVENCQSATAVESIDTFTDCEQTVTVQIVNDTTGNILSETTYNAIDGFVIQSVDYVLPTYGLYHIIVTASDCASSRVCSYYINACNGYRVTKTACHTYAIELVRPDGAPIGTDVEHTVIIVDQSTGAQVLNTTVTDATFPITYGADADSVYLISVATNTGQTYATEVIDVCDLLTCRDKLVQSLYCGTDDPCDKPCNTWDEASKLRYEISRLEALAGALEMAVFTYRTRYLGIPVYSDERLQDLDRIARIIKTIREVATRCGACAGQPSPVNPCRTC